MRKSQEMQKRPGTRAWGAEHFQSEKEMKQSTENVTDQKCGKEWEPKPTEQHHNFQIYGR